MSSPQLPDPAVLIAQSQAALARSQDMDRQASGNRGQSARLASEQANTLAFLAVAAGFARSTAGSAPSAAVTAQMEAMAAGMTQLFGAVASLQELVAAGQARDAAAQAELSTAISAEVTARQVAIDTERQRALLAEQANATSSTSLRQDLQLALAALTERTTRLETRAPAVASGRASTPSAINLAADATQAITVKFDAPAPSSDYLPMAVLDASSPQLLGALSVASITNRTTTGCTVTVRNTGLVNLAGQLAVTVLALKL